MATCADHDPTPGQSTPEYLTLQESYSRLVTHVSMQIDTLRDSLFETGLISSDIYDNINTIVTAKEKARTLIRAVMTKVELNPSNYNKFMDILKKEGMFTEDVCQELQKNFEQKKILSEVQCLKFVCPSSTQCTARQFFSRHGRCQQVTLGVRDRKSLFPFLDCSKLTKNEKFLLEGQLIEDTTKIFDSFTEMVESLITSLESRGLDVSRLRQFVSSAVRKHGNTNDNKCLNRATSIPDVFFALSSFISFFHYEIIERIVKRFGKKNDKTKMEEYIAALKEYCTRNVFEVPSNIFCNREPETGTKCFIFKLTRDEHKSLQDIADMRWKLAKILDIDVLSLQLCSITAGCVCLHFLVSEQEAKEIHEKTIVKESAFGELHIKFLEVSTVPEHSDKLSKKKSFIKEEQQAQGEKITGSYSLIESPIEQLYKDILSNGTAAKEKLKKFDFQKNLEPLLTELLRSEQLKPVHIETLIKHSERVNAKKFEDAFKQINLKVGEQLLRFCQQKDELLQRVLLLLSYNEEQIVELINDTGSDDVFCNKLLLNIDYLQSHGFKIMQKLSKSSRSKYLLKTMQNTDTEKALLVLQSGEIIPENIDLCLLIKKTVTAKDLLCKLIENGVNPCGLKSSTTTPLTILAKQYPNKKNLQMRCNTVECMQTLINAGANVEDLNSYFSGIKTTPIHVATDMALTTGKIDFLKLVCGKWSSGYSSVDGNGKTPLHIAAIGYKYCRYGTFVDIWKYLTDECKINKSIQDDRGKKAAFYLLLDMRKALNETNDELQDDQSSEMEPILKPSSPSSDIPNSPPTDKLAIDKEKALQVTVFGLDKSVRDSLEKHSKTPIDNEEDQLVETNSGHLSKSPRDNKQPAETNSEQECTEEDLTKMLEELFKKPNFYFEHEATPTVVPTHSEGQPRGAEMSSSHSKIPEGSSFSPETIAEAKWEVEILEHVKKDLRKMDSNPALRSSVFRTFQKLASGDWRDKLRIKVKVNKSSVVYKAEITPNNYLLYTFLDRFSERKTMQARSIVKDKQVYVYTKTIVILDIVCSSEVTHHAKRVLKIIDHSEFKQNLGNPDQTDQTYPQVSIRCESKLTHTERGDLAKLLTNINPNEDRNETDIGTKTYSLNVELVLGLLTGKCEQRDYPIKVTDDEFDIINKSKKAPIVLLGRSGTGKTTVCLCRLWREFIAHWDFNEKASIPKLANYSTNGACRQDSSTEAEFEHIHQIFITKSSKLCDQMKKRFREFIADYKPAEKHREVVDSLPDPKSFSEVNEMSYPLFLTARTFFSMLDKSLEDGKLFFQDEETLHSTEQPKSSKLQPLQEENQACSKKTGNRSKREEVTASLFQTRIWPKISKKSTDAKADPLLIWMEIQSYIKGSLQALESTNGVLSKEDYEEFGKKRAPNFPMNRENVYTLFNAYEQQIKHKDVEVGLFDNGDFIYKLYKRMKDLKNQSSCSVHTVYIDEVQDFTQAELSVIIRCCRCPNRCFFSGDTAQTIIKGIAFRFEDLVSIFHFIGKEKPELSMLTLNHRSHNGIARFASTITDLMRHFFPESFDWQKIPKDQSNIIGPTPLFAYSKDSLTSFLNLESEGDILFGANQVVIVRDDEDLVTVPDSLKQCIVLTINQCKGLEFNDVLLYNFFSAFQDNGDKAIWRASATYLKENPEEARDSYYKTKVRPLKFNEMHHKSLCAELKYLYTVATRAKHHLWIYEESSPESLPMLEYWHQRNVVQVMSSTNEFAEQLHIHSTPTSDEDWRRRGDELYKKDIWEEAVKCYTKAKEPLFAKQAHVKMLEKEAEEVPSTNTALYTAKWRLAAAGLISCDEMQHKTKYLQTLARHLQLLGRYRESAQLYERLNEIDNALDIYQFKLKDVDNTVRLMEKMRYYQQAVDYTCKHRQSLALELANRFERDGNLHKNDTEAIADREIIKFTISENIHKAEPWLLFIPDIEKYISKKKKENKKIVAFRVLEILNEFDKALFYARAQAMFTEGIKLATEKNRPNMVVILQLQQATRDMSRSRKIQTQGLLKIIRNISTTHQDSNIVARALVLLAKHKDEDSSTLVQIAKCEQARDIYKNKLRNPFGEIECYGILRDLMIEQLPLHTTIQETIAALKSVNQLIKDIHVKQLHATESMKLFYGFEPQGNGGLYFIPNNQDQWAIHYKPEDESEGIEDLDGMVQVSSRNLCRLVRSHLAQLTNAWLNDITSRLDTNFCDCGFASHNDIKYKRSTRISHSGAYNVEKYAILFELENQIVDLVCEQYKVHSKCTKRWIRQPIDTLVRLLSPYSQVYLQFTQMEYTAIQMSSLKPLLVKRLKFDLTRGDSFDTLLNAWQIQRALNLLELQEVASRANDVYGNYFSAWLNSHRLLRKGDNVLQAIEESTQYFVKDTEKYCIVSMENLVAILTVYTTALLAMLSSYSSEMKVFLPETFHKFVRYFDTTNSTQPGRDLYAACIATAKTLKAEEMFKKALRLLQEILNLLLGRREEIEKISPLTLFEDVFLLIMTIYSNLTLVLPNMEDDLLGTYEKILCLSQNLSSKFGEEKLKEAKTKRELFQVIEKLLEKMEMKVMQVKIVQLEETESIEFLPCEWITIPAIYFPKLKEDALLSIN